MWSTAIDSKDFMITTGRDESVGGFWSWGHKQLEYLPKNIGEQFPNLLDLTAGQCYIKEVSKKNFKGLSKLRGLTLNNNQIEVINDDTFEHIPTIEIIWLCKQFD